jgi:hypothetical protein
VVGSFLGWIAFTFQKVVNTILWAQKALIVVDSPFLLLFKVFLASSWLHTLGSRCSLKLSWL